MVSGCLEVFDVRLNFVLDLGMKSIVVQEGSLNRGYSFMRLFCFFEIVLLLGLAGDFLPFIFDFRAHLK